MPRATEDILSTADALALFRTRLANERTLLAYMRTALAILVVGGTVLHFLDGMITNILAGLAIALSVVLLLVGLYRFRRQKRRMDALIDVIRSRPRSQSPTPTPTPTTAPPRPGPQPEDAELNR